MVSGTNKVKQVSQKLASNGFNVLPVLAPTVAKGKERLRICLHAYNTQADIHKLLSILKEING